MSNVAILELQSPPDDVNVVHDFVEHTLTGHPEVHEMTRLEFETAIIELATNLFRHGAAGTPLRCTLSVTTRPSSISAEFRDQADEPQLPELSDGEMPDAMAESGRGLPLIRVLVDEFSYSRSNGWNTWTLLKSI